MPLTGRKQQEPKRIALVHCLLFSLIFSLFGSPFCSCTHVRCLLWHKMKLPLLQVNYFRIHCVLLSLWFHHLPRKQYTLSPNRNMDFTAADTWYVVYLRSLFIFRMLMDHLVFSYTTWKYVSSVFSLFFTSRRKKYEEHLSRTSPMKGNKWRGGCYCVIVSGCGSFNPVKTFHHTFHIVIGEKNTANRGKYRFLMMSGNS